MSKKINKQINWKCDLIEKNELNEHVMTWYRKAPQPNGEQTNENEVQICQK